MKKLFFISFLSLLCFSITIAQDRKDPRTEFLEKIKAEKISFFTNKLSLTPAEAQLFWPVYNEYEKKIIEIQIKRNDLENTPEFRIDKLSDQEITKFTKSYIESFEMEGNLKKEYYKKFLEVLPAKKVLQMYRTDNSFRSHLLRTYMPKRGPGGF